jgi:hypothetical protein
MIRIRGISALVAACVLAPAACGGDDRESDDSGGGKNEQVASVSRAAATTLADDTTETSASEADYRQAELDFAKCMRENGADVPDPVFDAGVEHGIDWPDPIFDPAGGPARVDVGPEVNADDPAFLSAHEACTAETAGLVDGGGVQP